MNIELLVNISRLFIPIIAFIGIYIAWQQFTANREKIRFELYDKRFKIYTTVFQFIDTLLWAGDESIGAEYAGFDLACHEAEFLLPESINRELRVLKDHIRSWNNVKRRIGYLNKKGKDEDKIEFAQEEIAELESNIEEMGDRLIDVFKEVLSFEKF